MAEQRYPAVLAVISDGLSISQVARRLGCRARRCTPGWLATRPRKLDGVARIISRIDDQARTCVWGVAYGTRLAMGSAQRPPTLQPEADLDRHGKVFTLRFDRPIVEVPLHRALRETARNVRTKLECANRFGYLHTSAVTFGGNGP